MRRRFRTGPSNNRKPRPPWDSDRRDSAKVSTTSDWDRRRTSQTDREPSGRGLCAECPETSSQCQGPGSTCQGMKKGRQFQVRRGEDSTPESCIRKIAKRILGSLPEGAQNVFCHQKIRLLSSGLRQFGAVDPLHGAGIGGLPSLRSIVEGRLAGIGRSHRAKAALTRLYTISRWIAILSGSRSCRTAARASSPT